MSATAIRERLKAYEQACGMAYAYDPREIDAIRELQDAAPADLAFLLNAHDALVGALREALAIFDGEMGLDWAGHFRPFYEQAHAALKLADVVTQPPRTPDVAP